MYNFVIYSNNLNLIKKFGNLVFNNFDDMHLVGISSTKSELTFLCSLKKVNLIIISSESSKDKSILEYIDNIESKIIICDDITSHKCSKHTLYISSSDSSESVLKKLNKFISNVNYEQIRKKVHKLLENLNFNFKLKGTNYLLEAIVYSYSTKDTYLFENLEKQIYPHVSEIYNVSVKNVKWSIIRSINYMKANLSKSNCKKYSTIIDNPEKLTPKYIISELINIL